jgi:hypothetical protein
MANYSIIENGRLVNLVVSDAEFAATQPGWVETPLGYGIGDFYDGTSFKKMSEVFNDVTPIPDDDEISNTV